jgi:hypothetical protein
MGNILSKPPIYGRNSLRNITAATTIVGKAD